MRKRTNDVFFEIRYNREFQIDDLEGIDDINALDGHGRNILQEAIPVREDISNHLLTTDININNMDSDGATPLQYALKWSRFEIATTLINLGANLNLRDRWGNNCLWTAVMNPTKCYQVISLLVQNGADYKNKNKAGRSPIDMAMTFADHEMLKIFGQEIS